MDNENFLITRLHNLNNKIQDKIPKLDDLMSKIAIGPKKNALMMEKNSFDAIVSSKEADMVVGSLLRSEKNLVKEYVCKLCETNGISKSFDSEWGLK
ncbi:unnamed protein product, partial [Brachionus calyciflorus]